MAKTPFPHLFQPLTLRHKTLKHRLNFSNCCICATSLAPWHQAFWRHGARDVEHMQQLLKFDGAKVGFLLFSPVAKG